MALPLAIVCAMTATLTRLILMFLLALASNAQAAPTVVNPDRARIEALAGEPQDAVRFFRVVFWQPIDEETLVVWLGKEEPYLLTLRRKCEGLLEESTLRLAEYSRPGRNMLRARWSQILTVDGRVCRITHLRALDLDGLRALGPRYVPAAEFGVASDPDVPRWEALTPIDAPAPVNPRATPGRSKPYTIELAAEVDDLGRVRNVQIKRSSGHNELDAIAMATVRRWRYEPHRQGHLERPVWVAVSVQL